MTRVRAYGDVDRQWVEELMASELGGRWQARRGELVDVLVFAGLIAEDEQANRLGYLSYCLKQEECEIAALVAAQRHCGIGTAVVEALKRDIESSRRIWLVTTNDNLEALRFYQRRGFRLAALRAGAVDEARARLKPTISTTGAFGIPIRDELELELLN